MKKLVLLLAAAVALSASAAGTFKTHAVHKSVKRSAVHTDRLFEHKASNSAKQLAPVVAAPIYDQPAGELKSYNRTGQAFVASGMGSLYLERQTGIAKIVWADDNKVYLLDPIYGFNGMNVWVEGTVEGNEIHVPMGQMLYDGGPGNSLVLAWVTTSTEEDPENPGSVFVNFTTDERVTEAVYAIDGKNLTLLGTEGNIDADFPACAEMTGLSAVWDGGQGCYGNVDIKTVYAEREHVDPLPVIYDQPEGRLVEYKRSGECIAEDWLGLGYFLQDGKAIVVYGDDNKVYLQDPIYGIKVGSWVEGYIDGNTIHVPTGQCLYWDENNERGQVMSMIDTYTSPDGYTTYTFDTEAEITYTVDGNTISLNDTWGDVYDIMDKDMRAVSTYWNDDHVWSGYTDWETVYKEIVLVPAVPADPRIDEEYTYYQDAWYDCGSEEGYSALHYAFITEDVDGNEIDFDHMSYSIYTDDDQLYTFKAEDYPVDLTEDATEIPCNFYGYGFSPYQCYFYRTNAPGYETFFTQRIGIQVHYTIDGVKNSSNIVYYYLPVYTDNGTPNNPEVLNWSDCGHERGYSMLTYKIDEYTTDGERMDPYRMYYSLFTDDDQIFTFDYDHYYREFDQDVTMVPYTHGGWDVSNSSCWMYRTNAGIDDEGNECPIFFNHQIGIQVYYEQADGSLKASDIIYLEVFEPGTGINEVAAGKTVASTRYFNMAGQEMSEAKGICIAVTTYTDGTTSAVKVVK